MTIIGRDAGGYWPEPEDMVEDDPRRSPPVEANTVPATVAWSDGGRACFEIANDATIVAGTILDHMGGTRVVLAVEALDADGILHVVLG